jgi:hypothetical protein
MKLLSITVKGDTKRWSFAFYGDPKYLEEWRADGLDVNEIYNVVPIWVTDLGLVRVGCFLQDIWNLKNPFRKE